MIKKSLSIVFLLIYLGIIYMPYAPYVYIVAISEQPDLIIQNNMEYLSAYNITTCILQVKIACDYIEYSSIIKNLIQEVDSPPPKQS